MRLNDFPITYQILHGAMGIDPEKEDVMFIVRAALEKARNE
jgi:hypothetical protein